MGIGHACTINMHCWILTKLTWCRWSHGASAPTILCALERSSIEVVCLTRNSCSDGLILLQQHLNTISDKNIWYWINFGAFFDQNDVIARAKSPTLRVFPGKPGGSFKLSFFASFMIWSPLSGDIPSIRVDQSKFKCFMLRFGCFMSRSSVSIFKMLEKM